MRLSLVAIGRVRGGPEQELVADYLSRAERTGRGIGLSSAKLIEVDPRGATGPAAEADALARALPKGGRVICLDERGRAMTSPDLARTIGEWRDSGLRDAAFVIGGADGLDPGFVARAELTLSMGKLVWPHLLARVMVAEQIYRVTSILAGTPYHRA
ncbi:MAG: 23S rRNA (pseudouridine(1915)-N(3))-methyltransferase RlmH [Pseudomonadota bacterium]